MAALDEVASSSTLHRVVARRGLKLRAAPSLTSAPVGLVPFGAAVAVDVDGAVELEGRKTRVRCTPRGEGYAAGWSTWNPKLLAPDDDADGAAVLARLEAADRGDVTPELAGECCVAAVCKGTHLLPICEALAARVDADDAVGALCASALAFASSARSGFRVAASAGPEDAAPVAVVILGFGGSSLPELQGIVDHYANARPRWRRVVAVTPAFAPPALRGAAEAQIDDVVARCAGAHHVLCHAFSNNGASALGRLIEASPEFKKRLRGCVFDSAADMHGDEDMMIDAIGGMVKNLFRGTKAGLTFAKAVDGPAFGACVARVVRADDGAVLRIQTRGLERLCSDLPPYCRYLFVHGAEDALIRKPSIDAFITLLRCFASLPIETVVFEKSPHCRHFDFYQERYTAAVDAFFDDAVDKAPRGSAL